MNKSQTCYDNKIQKIIALLCCALFLSHATHASELRHLEGDEAIAYIGDIKSKFSSAEYTYEILQRRHRDSMNGRNSDAVIFSKIGDRILYRRRDDGNHWFVLNHPEGREEDPSSDHPLVWNPIANTLQDDHPNPHVYLDENGSELAVIFIGTRSRIQATLDRENRLEIKITIKQAGRSARRGVGIK